MQIVGREKERKKRINKIERVESSRVCCVIWTTSCWKDLANKKFFRLTSDAQMDMVIERADKVTSLCEIYDSIYYWQIEQSFYR